MILSCTVCGSLYSIFSRCVSIEDESSLSDLSCSSPFCPIPLFRQYLLYTLQSNVSLLRPIKLEKLG
jgi:hypothetical protein